MTFEEANITLRKYHYGKPLAPDEYVVEALESFHLNEHKGVCNNCIHHKECEAPKYPPVYECVYFKGV